MYLYTCIHAYMHTCIHTYIHMYIIYIHFFHVGSCSNKPIHIYCWFLYEYIYICIHSYIVLHIYMHKQSHTYIPSNPIVLYIYIFIIFSWAGLFFTPLIHSWYRWWLVNHPVKKNKVKSSSGARNTPTILISRLYLDYLPVVIGYPLVMSNIAIEAMAYRKFVDLPSYKMVDLSIVFCMFTRPGKSH